MGTPFRTARIRRRSANVLRRGAWHGLVAGAAGVAVMTLAEKAEQAVTGRPDSHVPRRTLLRVPGSPVRPEGKNLTMHLGQGVLLGALRGVMADAGLRGGWASAMFGVVRLTNDQVLENVTGVGAPPWTWPRRELVIDLLHKAIYAYATGAVADRLAARLGDAPGLRHARLREGRHPHVGPV
ncbi:hypothetical protein A8924_5925 [Saccharopolyspora erythraea NRRL 2338]|uniref:Uncharacterized protein n=2 Tax=Saccharopolyspora erythraea TaxID=1836 RepID=A4FL46_SACEN|nr:hypothetical protein [Saccharopolyspora erythraea]EQD83730.1 hypothetical protein N599_23630 [Saccharopolyspora erythraea D]PFG98411.1 hypothetical protein A8924_5925 [Saccharopolyspora erythraea NRRL 2338]QRK88479.1 hypothetical protein JQX30_28010 [Saccharopolyspora erythraea]CAM04771.1 hypothetical protein SACE_5585 [Saccharopolyspora erythraea NRRL 2338]